MSISFTHAMADSDARYAAESSELVTNFDNYIRRNFGERCEEFEPCCPICEMWKKRDDLKKFICD